MDNQNKSSTVASVLLEILIAAVLIILILGTLNYFNIIPIANTVPALSFLPTQSRITSPPRNQNQQGSPRQQLSNQNNSMKNVRAVFPVNPNKYTNFGKEFSYKYIENSSAKFNDFARIDIILNIKNNESSSSGVIFGNGKDYVDVDHRSFKIFKKGLSSWILEHRSKGKSTYTGLSKTIPTAPQQFIITISADGKRLTISGSNVPARTISLFESLYDSGRQINGVAEIAPGSEIDIYSLDYQF